MSENTQKISNYYSECVRQGRFDDTDGFACYFKLGKDDLYIFPHLSNYDFVRVTLKPYRVEFIKLELL